MSIITNPVLVSVVVLCLLCLCKLNVLMALILSALTGAVLAGISIPDAMGILCDGFGANAGTALAAAGLLVTGALCLELNAMRKLLDP